MLRDEMPQRKLLAIDHGAYHMDIYKAFCDYLAAHRNKPMMMIIPINMQTFAPGWDLRPNWQFEKTHFFLKWRFLGKFYKPLTIFDVVSSNTITFEEFYNTKVYVNDKEVGKVSDFDVKNNNPNLVTPEDTEKAFLFNYMYSLKHGHRKLHSLEHIIDTLDSANIRATFYFEPIDFDSGNDFIGDDFSKRVQSNIAVVKDVLYSKQVEFLDMSHLLPAQRFVWHSYPNGHVDQHGRLAVAKQLAEYLKVVH
jgi:hypothetical protein